MTALMEECHALHPELATCDFWPDASGLNVLAIYEDFVAGVRVGEAFEWIIHCTPDLPVHRKAWNFSALLRPDLRNLVMHLVTGADLLIIAAQGDEAPPVHIIRLLDRCAEEGDEAHPSAVIALHDDGLVPPERSVPLCACLERMARRCHAKFISEDDFESELSPERLARYMQATLSIAT